MNQPSKIVTPFKSDGFSLYQCTQCNRDWKKPINPDEGISEPMICPNCGQQSETIGEQYTRIWPHTPGFRLFTCKCLNEWKERSSDCTSPLGAYCPNFYCHTFVYPMGFETHPEWEVDSEGNLL